MGNNSCAGWGNKGPIVRREPHADHWRRLQEKRAREQKLARDKSKAKKG
jgi:hypothetical protein